MELRRILGHIKVSPGVQRVFRLRSGPRIREQIERASSLVQDGARSFHCRPMMAEPFRHDELLRTPDAVTKVATASLATVGCCC
jgi:hypothetical protein